jgi:hypothetical protein
MANQFLVEIHDYISRQIEAVLKDSDEARVMADAKRLAFLDGKLFELRLMRSYLSEHFDLSTQKYY